MDSAILHDTEARVLAWCEQAGLFAHGQRVAAAVSGGADSMALLRILLALAGRLEVEVSACHVNHKLRGAAADADEAFVREECARLGVPLQVCRAGEDGLPLAGGGEAGARALRYACFERVHAGGIDRIATAHTVTDQAETLLFRLARGTGLHGAGGIRPARDFYVRPSGRPTPGPSATWPASAKKPPGPGPTLTGRPPPCWNRPPPRPPGRGPASGRWTPCAGPTPL